MGTASQFWEAVFWWQNFGSHIIVPIDCYIDRLADKHIKKYFVRLLYEIYRDFSYLLPREQFEKIVNFVRNF